MKHKLPAMQWYIGDWRKDIGAQSLTLEEKGAWRELLDAMWESEYRGKLMLNGRAMTAEEVGIYLGVDEAKAKQLLAKFLSNGVASIEQTTGIIYCRRMVRYERLRRSRSEAGRSGGQAKHKQKPEAKVAASSSEGPSGGVSSDNSLSSDKSLSSEVSSDTRGAEARRTSGKGTATKPEPDSRVKILVDYHFEKWGQRQVELGGNPEDKYALDAPNEPVALKRLLKKMDDLHVRDSLERIKQLLDRYFTIEDPFIQNSGHSISLFCKVINKLQRPPARNEPKSWKVLRQMACEFKEVKPNDS
jgi:hypothetical protein